MRKRLLPLAAALLTILLVASPVLAFLFRAPLTIAESNGTAYSMLAVGAATNNKYLAANGFMSSNARDTKVGTLGGTAYPHMVSDSFTWTATALPANGQVNLYYSTGETSADFDIVLGNGGTFTVKDVAALEPGSNFETEITAYVGEPVTLGNKADALLLTDDGAGTITASIAAGAGVDAYLYPVAAGDYTNINGQTPAATEHWDKVDEAVGAYDDATTVVYDNNGDSTMQSDAYNLTDSVVPTGALINSVSVFMRIANSGGVSQGRPGVRLSGAETTGTLRTPAAGVWTSYTEALARPGGGSWTPSDLNSLQVIIGLDDNTQNGSCTQIYAIVNYSITTLTAAGVTDGAHEIRLTSNGATTKLYIDDVEEDSVAVAAVPNNANDWILTPSPWWSYYKHTVGGTLIAHFQPQDIIRGAAYSTGTVTVTNGDATVEGAGGATWTDAHDGGIFVSADGAFYVIDSIIDTDTLELTTVYGGGTLAGQTYNFYPRLPDRQGTAQDGRITFGSNPAGVAAALGGMISGSQPAPGVGGGEEDTPGDQMPVMPSSGNWQEDGTVSAALLAMPIRPLVTMVSNNTPMTELEVWMVVGGTFIVGILVLVAKSVKGHHLITGIATGGAIGLTAVVGIFTLWLLLLAVLAVIVGAVFDRTPSVS